MRLICVICLRNLEIISEFSPSYEINIVICLRSLELISEFSPSYEINIVICLRNLRIISFYLIRYTYYVGICLLDFWKNVRPLTILTFNCGLICQHPIFLQYKTITKKFVCNKCPTP